MKWTKASERLPEKEGEYFIIDGEGIKRVMYASGVGHHTRWKNIVYEWLDEESNVSSQEPSIEQDFKELSISLDYLCLQTEKDAGHSWIAFTDKFNAFKRKVLSLLNKLENAKECDATEAKEISEPLAIKSIPEVLELDGVINTYVHSHGSETYKHIQKLFWKAIDAIQKKPIIQRGGASSTGSYHI